jgi:D-glycero-D-manno-heptose 1,7-bisphosphate phosphatase
VPDPGYLRELEQVQLLPGVAPALVALREAGWRLVVVTNQSGVARGYLTEARLAAIHARLEERLAAGGAGVDAIYYCPHHPEAPQVEYRLACPCRKPSPGMLLAAAADLDLDLGDCWMIGDQPRDALAAQAAGCRWVLSAAEGREPPDAPPRPGLHAGNLEEAAAIVLGGREPGPPPCMPWPGGSPDS